MGSDAFFPGGERLLTASSIRDGEEKGEKKRGTPPPRKHNQSESRNSRLNGAAFQICLVFTVRGAHFDSSKETERKKKKKKLCTLQYSK